MSTQTPAGDGIASQQNAATAPAKQRSGGGFARFVRDIVFIVVAAVVISFVLKTFLIRSFFIPSGSMEQTLQIQDRVMVNQLVPDVVDIQRGDVVVFHDPGGWLLVSPQQPASNPVTDALRFIGLAPEDSGNYLIKRVIGVGGDHVKCCSAEGKIEVNGQAIDEPYVNLPEGAPASQVEFDVTVPEGSLWVLGDNRNASKDSRYNQDQPGKGFVSEKDVVGKAFVLNWPLERFTWLGNYPEVFKNVPAAAK